MSQSKQILLGTERQIIEVLSDDKQVNALIEYVSSISIELKEEQSIETKKGRDQIASDAFKFSKAKSKINKLRLESTKDYRDKITNINKNGKLISEHLDLLKDDVREPLTIFEKEAEDRLNEIQLIVDHIIDCGESGADIGDNPDIDLLIEKLEYLESLVVTEEAFQGLFLQAQAAHKLSLASIKTLIQKETKRAAEEEELQALREQAAARKAQEAQEAHDLKIRKQVELKAKEEAKKVFEKQEARKREIEQEKRDAMKREKQAVIDAESARIEKEQAIQRGKEQAIQAEKDRILAEKQAEQARKEAIKKAKIEERERVERREEQARKEQKEREDNLQLRAKIHKEAKKSLMDFTDEETATSIVKAMSAGLIKNVTISY